MRDDPGFEIGPALIAGSILVWIFVFVVTFAQQRDFSGDGTYTVSDVPGVARQATVGWVEDYAATLPCEPQNGSDRFFETSPCEFVRDIKWLLAAVGYGMAGLLLSVLAALYHRLAWLLRK